MYQNNRIDWHLIIPIFILLTISLIVLVSLSIPLFFSQLIFIFFGLLAFFLLSRFHFQHHFYLIKGYIVFSFILLLLPFVFGVVTRGSVRWIQLGSLTIQPSEIIKPLLILIFSSLLAKKSSKHIKQFSIYFLALLMPVFLILKQPDLGSSLVVIVIWLGILFTSNLPSKYFFSTIGLGLISLPIFNLILEPYQKQRLTSFINPFADPKGSGYHLIQSIIAVGAGGFFGKGLGAGTQSQLRFLPERHTDFIFATLAEELGFVGALVLLATYFFLFKRLITVAKLAPDKFSQLTVIGVFMMLFFQVIITIAMNLGLMPITGITLPLVSAGGSSILASLTGLSLVNSISKTIKGKQTLEIS